MGSLVPGWNAPLSGVPPPELREFDEMHEEREGYFAKLEKQKTLKRSSTLNYSDSAALQHSTPQSPTLSRASVEYPSTISTTIGAVAHVKPDYHYFGSLGHNKYEKTDWEAEIKALQRKTPGGGGSLARSSLDSRMTHASKDTYHTPGWWAQLDTGALNAAQIEEAPGVKAVIKGKGVKLDFEITGTQLGQSLKHATE